MYKERKELYKQIEKLRDRPLITYVTSIRNGLEGQMTQDVIPKFIKQLDYISKEKKEIDLLIISNGGDPIVSWRIISLLRERFEQISILIPYKAYSAATMLSLGANEIIMHPYANLGPIDLQINYKSNNVEKSISYEDIVKYFEFTDKINLSNKDLAFEKLTNEIPATLIGFARRSHNLEYKLSERLLETHLSDKEKVKKIISTLNSEFYHHGYPLGRTEAKNIGLNVVNPDNKLEKLMWKIYLDFENEYKFNEIFDKNNVIFNKIIKSNNINVGNNTIVSHFKVASLESINIDSCIKEEIIANFNVNENKVININDNIIIKPGNWEDEYVTSK